MFDATDTQFPHSLWNDPEAPQARRHAHPVGDALLPLLEPMLNAVDYGMAVLGGDTALLYINRAGRAAFTAFDSWTLSERQLVCNDGALREGWLRALHQARDRGLRSLVDLALEPTARYAAVAPLPGIPGHVFVAIGRQQTFGSLETQLFASRHRLTATETRVLECLCGGMAPAEIAHAHGVALSTISTQVVSIRGKTGAASIRALLQAVSRLPPLRPAVDRAPGAH